MPTDRYDYTEDFQLKILACIVKHRSFMTTHRTVLSPHYFEHEHLISLSKLIFKYFDNYKHVPPKEELYVELSKLNVKYKLPSTMYTRLVSTLDAIYSCDISSSSYISDEVSQFGTKQSYKSTLMEAITLMKSNKIDDIRESFKKALIVGCSRNSTISFEEVATDLHASVPYFSKDPNMKVVPTLFPSLDKALTFGGLRSGELLEIIGHPGYGKSTLATNFALNAALDGFEVDIISTELTASAYILKIASRLTHMPTASILENYTLYLERINKFFEDREIKLRIQTFPMYKCTTDDIQSYISTQINIKGANPGLLVLDSADHILARKGGIEKSRLDFGIIYGELINIGREYEFPIIVTTQGNRATMGNGVFGIEGDSESSHKAAMSDVVLTLSRTEDQIAENLASVFVAKLREGKDKFTIPTQFDLARSFIKEIL